MHIPKVDRMPGTPCNLQNNSGNLKSSCSVEPGTRSGIITVAAAGTAAFATLSTRRAKASASSDSSMTMLEAIVIRARTSLVTRVGIIRSMTGLGVDIALECGILLFLTVLSENECHIKQTSKGAYEIGER